MPVVTRRGREYSTQELVNSFAMKINRKKVVLFVVAGPVIFAIAAFVSILVHAVVCDWLGYRHIARSDHAELLRACRQMISSYGSYSSDFDNPNPSRKEEKGLSFWNIRDGYTYETDPRLPKAIRTIEPIYVYIGTNYLTINLRYPSRTVIVADGGGASAVISNRFRNLSMLTNGLWFCH